jgi:hypothetical protein
MRRAHTRGSARRVGRAGGSHRIRWRGDRFSSRRLQANERIESTAEKMGLAGPVPFICECSDPTCMEIVRLDVDEYEEVRCHPRRFFSVPDHAAAAVQAGAAVVAKELPGYTLSDKIGVAGEVAEKRHEDLLS